MIEFTTIGVAGCKNLGKDELANYLSQQIGWGRISFATPVKKIFCDIFGVDFEFIEKWKNNPNPPPGFNKNVRESLQFIGDGFRSIQDDVWVKIAFREEDNYRHKAFSDVRYPHNEAKASFEAGGFNILLYRPGFLNNDLNGSEAIIRKYIEWCVSTGKEGIIRKWSEYQALVQEEKTDFATNLSYFDYFLINDGNKEHLYNKIDNHILPLLYLPASKWKETLNR